MTHFGPKQPTMMASGGGAGSGGAAAAPDFGKAGKLTVRTNLGAVALHLDQGQYLSYKLTVKGVSPVFTFSCEHRKIKTDKDFGSPAKTYSWNYFQSAGDDDSHDDVYTVALSFLGAPMTYTLAVNKCDKTGTVLQPLKDFDASSTDPNDFYMDGLRVLTM